MADLRLIPAEGEDYRTRGDVLTAFRQDQPFRFAASGSDRGGSVIHPHELDTCRVEVSYRSLTRTVTLIFKDAKWSVEEPS